MIAIKHKDVPLEKVQYKCPFDMVAEGICIHNTANSASAEREINFMLDNNDYTSFHFAVDDKEAVQAIPIWLNGWHAGDGWDGDGNRKYIAIEICYSYVIPKNGLTEAEAEKIWAKTYKKKFEKAQENAASLCAYLLYKCGWGCDFNRIKKHQDFDGKYCPHRTLSDYGWDFFKKLVEKKYEEMYERDLPMTTAERKEFEALQDQVVRLTERLNKYDDMGVYDNAAIRWAYIDKNLPEWAKPTLEKLRDRKILQGTNKNSFELSYDLIRTLVMLDRAGAFD